MQPENYVYDVYTWVSVSVLKYVYLHRQATGLFDQALKFFLTEAQHAVVLQRQEVEI